MTSSLTQSERPIERASRAMRIASSAVRQPAVLGRMRYRFQSMTSRIVFFFGSSRSRRRSATVTSSLPDASSAASIDASSRYLPVPRKRRERSVTPATTRGSACVTVCTGQSLREPHAPPAQPLRRLRRHLPMNGEEPCLKVLLSEQRLVAAIREALGRLVHGQPKHLVDLDAGLELAAARLHLPVASDLVAATAVDVSGAADGADELAAQPRLLAHLAQRAVLRALVGLDFAFGKCPVVVSGSVDHGDLGFPRPRLTKHEAARSPDHVHIGYFKDLCCHRCSFVS